MAGINIGSNAILGGYLGSTPLATVYIGDQEIWTSNFTGITMGRTLSYVATGGTKTLKVKAGDDWSLATDADWLTISPSSGTSGTTMVSVSAANYTSDTENRTAVITGTTNGGAVKTCNVTQNRVTTIIIPDSWDFLLVMRTTTANETVPLKSSECTQSFDYINGEDGTTMVASNNSYTFADPGLHPVFYRLNGSGTPGTNLFRRILPRVYGCYFNGTSYVGKYIPKGMFWVEGSAGYTNDSESDGTYLYIPEGMGGIDGFFSHWYWQYLKTLVIPSTMVNGWNSYSNTDWALYGLKRCDTIYNFTTIHNLGTSTCFYYGTNAQNLGALVTGPKTQYYAYGGGPFFTEGIRYYVGVEMAQGATMESMGLSRTVYEWYDEVTNSIA